MASKSFDLPTPFGPAMQVKLPKRRVAELVEAGEGQPFDPGRGRKMKEWPAELPAAEEVEDGLSAGLAVAVARRSPHTGCMPAQVAQKPSEPLIIYRSVNGNGETYALEARSLQRIREKLGSGHVRARVFLSHETGADFEHIHGHIVPQIVMLLTGVPEERLRPLGRVTFRDPLTERDVPVSSQ